jgi:hypothetical protein
MKQNKKKVLCIDSDPSFLNRQEEKLENKELGNYFYPFNDFRKALQFIEKQIITNNQKLHYILLDEKITGEKLPASLDKISGLKTFLKKPEVIVCTNNNSDELRNRVMQYPVVSTFLVKPIPKNYIEFLITGNSV